MILTYKDLHRLQFPIYQLPSDNWYKADGVLFIDELVLDEKNMPGDTLGIRRLQSARKDLFPLKQMIRDLPSFIRAKKKFFIDSKGIPFEYQKTTNSKLKCYKIKRIEKKEVVSILWLYGWPTPFTIPRPPSGSPEYVRMLHISGAPWIVYDYVRRPVKDTYRRV